MLRYYLNTQINKLNTDKEKLINANSNLMLKIATGLEEPINNTKDKSQKEYKMLLKNKDLILML